MIFPFLVATLIVAVLSSSIIGTYVIGTTVIGSWNLGAAIKVIHSSLSQIAKVTAIYGQMCEVYLAQS